MSGTVRNEAVEEVNEPMVSRVIERLTHWRTWMNVGFVAAAVFTVAISVPGAVGALPAAVGLPEAETVWVIGMGSLALSFVALALGLVFASPGDE